MRPVRDEIAAARERIRAHVHETPVFTSARLGDRVGGLRLGFKCESLQRTGSFKARGALNAMMQLSPAERRKGVVTVSAGNHAQALAWASSMVGADCITCMPEGASQSKIAATQGYGGRVEVVPGGMQRAFDRANEIAAEGRVMIHPFEDERVAAGQGTVALELLEQMPDLDVVIIPIGGGGLISGMAVVLKAVKPGVRIFGVEPEGAPTMRKSLDAGSVQRITPKTIADGLSAPLVCPMTLEVVRTQVEDVAIVSDDDILAAMRDLLGYMKLLVEPAGAAALAALLTRKIPLKKGSHAAVVISGGNVDIERLKQLL